MKIAIFSDPHLGYARFEEDSYVQAECAIIDASNRADVIFCAGDIFDIKIPKLETLKRAVDIFNKATVPVYAIHGNHERRSKDLTGPAQLLASSTDIVLLHGQSAIFEKNGERVQLFGLGSVPEEYADSALKKCMERFVPDPSGFKILMLHQSIKELMPDAEEEISLEYLDSLPFDLVINGHIHKTIVDLGGRFLIPGSTVITQLKKDEMESKGYFLYDTKTKTSEFVPIQSRKFFYEELKFENASESEIKQKIKETIQRNRLSHPNCLVAIKLDGTLKDGLGHSDISLDSSEQYSDVFIDNRLNLDTLHSKLEKIRLLRQDNL
ncbi:DNA repair exonuclease, partial [Candidatus Micrarchaeota archaeon]|nr:DNA repair exonuclease [Candidatus Micrarchaeota archaeon]